MFPIIITCGSPQREEIFFRKILGGGIYNKLNFIKQNYTDFEEERLREKKGIQINIRSSAHHREKKFFFFNNNNNNI